MSARRAVGVVLTGGASRRMGVDKATIVVDGKPMAVRVADALWEAGCQPVECQGGNAHALTEYGLEVVADREAGRGPVVAIHEALRRHEGSDLVVAACDLVDLDGADVAALISAGAADEDVDVAVARSGDLRHLVSWWRSGTGPRLGALLADGVTGYLDAIARLRTADVAVSSVSVTNINAPSDLDGRR